jgi:hypothetical protein
MTLKKMNKLRVGLKVKIARWSRNPDYWDDDEDMMALAKEGETHTVSKVMENPETYRLERLNWNWRRKDLIVVDTGAGDPNLSFIIKRI